MKDELRNALRLLVSLAIPLGVGFASAFTKTAADAQWYLQLNLPDFTPSPWAFKWIWTCLYVLMGISLYLIWTNKPSSKRTVAIALFGIQLFLNAMWSVLFFSLRSPQAAMIEMIILFVFIVLTIHAFFRVSKVVGWLFIPYVGWVAFALFLNVTIFLMNS